MNVVSTTAVARTTRPIRRRLDPSRWSGIVFVVLAVPALILATNTDANPYESTPQEYVDAYANGAIAPGAGVFLAMLALVALVWALARLRVSLTGERTGIAAAAMGSAGTLFAVAWVGIFATGTAQSRVVEEADTSFEVVPDTAVVLDFITDAFFVALSVAAAVLAWAVALAGRRAGLNPGWLAWVGVVLAVLLPFAWLFVMVPALLFLVWLATIVAVLPEQSAGQGAS